jgi:hypothetical protein
MVKEGMSIAHDYGGPIRRIPITIEHPIRTDFLFYNALVQEFGFEDLLLAQIWGEAPHQLRARREAV